jgi:hypothetical protein
MIAYKLSPAAFQAALEIMEYAWTGTTTSVPLTGEYWLQGFYRYAERPV